MGCVNAKPDINDRHPNIFQVANVNDEGVTLSPGKLEVTESELVFHQRGKNPTKWPLRTLRKYGYDSGVFSFECGRRCPTGEGIYAFKCRRAEQLFNMVQQHIIDDTNPLNSNALTPNSIQFPIPAVSTGPPVSRIPSQTDGHVNSVPASNNAHSHPALSRPGSITSNGPASPPAISPLTSDIALEHNNNKRGSLLPDITYTHNVSALDNGVPPSYANMGVINSPTSIVSSENCLNIVESHVYMNIDTKDVSSLITNAKEITEKPEQLAEVEDVHCYANIDSSELEHLRPILMSNDIPLPSVPQTPTGLYITVQEVNYAELDLETSKKVTIISQVVPESPVIEKKSYATIDFQKTTALSQSKNPRIEIEEGSRKTRHNSSINEITTRHSNSLSD